MASGALNAFLRRRMLAYGRRMDLGRMLDRSRQGAVQAAIVAARVSKAYRQLLREHGMNAAALGNDTDPASLPVLTKTNTFGRFSLADLARPVPAAELADVLTSSGRGGRSFGFRLTARKQHENSWFGIDLGLQDVFKVDDQPTLLVNCLPMGVVFRSRAVAVANVSVREDMACSILRDIGPRFKQTLLCTDPLFIRRLLDEAQVAGVDWKALNTSVIVGEEILVEAQRDYIAARMGIDLDRDRHRMIGSSFGVGELGLNLLFETRETIRMRRAMRKNPELARILGGQTGGIELPSIFCFNPLRTYIEVLSPDADGFGELCITMLDRHAVIPLPRYATGDMGKVLPREQAVLAAGQAASEVPWLPMVALRGRLKDRPAGHPSVETIKELLYRDHAAADRLTGAFRIGVDSAGMVHLTLQASTEAAASSPDLLERLTAIFNPDGSVPLAVEVLGPTAFPWRPTLDYERKFAYVDA